MTTNSDIEEQIAQRIRELLQELGILSYGYCPVVRLHGKERGKRRSAAFEKNWSLSTDSIHISFQPMLEKSKRREAAGAPPREPSPETAGDPLPELIRALDRAESRPGYDFIALKWFRDTALVSERFGWVAAESTRHEVLREAIDRRLILTHKVPNPKSPQFPVTAIRLNRQMPEVMAVLGSWHGDMPDFRPVSVRGEPLSVTVLRDRR